MQHADVRVIREVLEDALSSSQTSSILFEALDGLNGAIPQSGEDLRALVEGPLTRALEKQLGGDRTREIVASIESRLRLEEADVSGARPRSPIREDEATTTVPTATDPVAVAVVAASPSFARRLEVVLGPRRISPFTLGSLDQLSGLTASEPALVLVDCTDFAPIDTGEMVRALSALPSHTVRVVWGSNLPYGRSLVETMTRAEVPHTPIDRREGLEPLLDLVRARHRAV